MYPKCLPWALISALLTGLLKLHKQITNSSYFENVFEHPYVYQIYTFVLGFILVFRCNLSFQRFWEGRSSIQLMSSKWADAALQAIVFDDVSASKSRLDVHLWRTQYISLMSIMHGTALAQLSGWEHKMPIIEGVDPRVMEARTSPLSTPPWRARGST